MLSFAPRGGALLDELTEPTVEFMQTRVEKAVRRTERATRSRSVEELVARAADLFGQSNLEGARDLLRQAVAREPDRVESRLFLGNVLHRLRDPDGTREQFAEAVALDPANMTALTSLAAACMALGELGEAERSIRAALRVTPGDAEALRFLGTLCLQSGEFGEGAEAYRRLLERNSEDIDSLLSQARCFFELGDLAEAATNYSRVLALEPKHPLASENLAVVRRRAETLETPLPAGNETLADEDAPLRS